MNKFTHLQICEIMHLHISSDHVVDEPIGTLKITVYLGHSFTKQWHFGKLKMHTYFTQMSFKVQVENYTVIV